MPKFPSVNIFTAPQNSAWGGDIILSREIHNPTTEEERRYEGHEFKAIMPGDDESRNGSITTAVWDEGDNNIGGSEFPERMEEWVRYVLSLPLPEGWVEGALPE